MNIATANTTNNSFSLTLIQGASFPLSFSFVSGCAVPIVSCVSGLQPVLNFATAHEFRVGDKVQVLNVIEGTNQGLKGAATVVSVSQTSITVEMLNGNSLLISGNSEGYAAKCVNLAGYFLIGAIYSHLPSDPSPLGLQGAIDAGSNQILVKGARTGDFRTGDLLTLDAAGIRNARITNIQSAKSLQNSSTWSVVSVDQIATTSVSPNQMKQVTRRGSMLAQFRALPVGDGSTGVITGGFSAIDTLKLFGSESSDPSCGSVKEVGCYQLLLGRGFFGGKGYKPVYTNWIEEIQSGAVFVKPSILRDFEWDSVVWNGGGIFPVPSPNPPTPTTPSPTPPGPTPNPPTPTPPSPDPSPDPPPPTPSYDTQIICTDTTNGNAAQGVNFLATQNDRLEFNLVASGDSLPMSMYLAIGNASNVVAGITFFSRYENIRFSFQLASTGVTYNGSGNKFINNTTLILS